MEHRLRPARPVVAVLTVCLLAATAIAVAGPDRPGSWPPLPPGTETILLATGGDAGYYHPKGCNQDGGALYRLSFDRWLAQTAPAVRRLWVSAGDIGPLRPATDVMDLAPLTEYFAKVGYAMSGVGTMELNNPGPVALVEAAANRPFPFLATNLRVHETGAAPFPTGLLLDIGTRRVLFLAIVPDLPERAWGSPRTGTIVTVPSARAVRDELDARRDQYDTVVLLSAENGGLLRDLLKEEPRIDLVLASAGAMLHSDAETIGRATVLWLGMDGRMLGRVALDAEGRVLEARCVRVAAGFPVDPMSGAVVADIPSSPAPVPATSSR